MSDEYSQAFKIGKAKNPILRMAELQVGNPNPLKLVGTIKCASEKQSFLLESLIQSKFKDIHKRGEWYKNDSELLNYFDCSTNEIFPKYLKRDGLKINTLFGEEYKFESDDRPRCFFYPNLFAEISQSYEKSLKSNQPFRTMRYPTKGKQLLLPYSNETNRVFISGKKHEENLELQKFLDEAKPKEFTRCYNDNKIEFIEEKNTLEKYF